MLWVLKITVSNAIIHIYFWLNWPYGNSNVSSQQVLGFTYIDNFSKSFTHFTKFPISFLIIPIVKLAKIWVLLENLIKRKSVFQLKLCVITTKILLSNSSKFKSFQLF